MATPSRDHYAILGLAPTATPAEIGAAFRRLARRHHPGVLSVPDAAPRFREVCAAHAVLADPRRRAAYDRQRQAAARPRAGEAPGAEGPGAPGPPFADLFDQVFVDQEARPPRPRAGDDRQVELTLSLREAIAGAERPVALERLEACADCRGRRAAPGAAPTPCAACGGTGETRAVQSIGPSVVTRVTACAACDGDGVVIAAPCPACRGDGRALVRRTLAVTIPPGVDDGASLRLRGEGDAGRAGGMPGDLLVRLRVAPDPTAGRAGDDLLVDLAITPAQAAAGALMELPTWEGPLPVTIPPGATDGQMLRATGRGVPRLRGGGRGDLVITLRVRA